MKERTFYRLCLLPAILVFGALAYAVINMLNRRELRKPSLEFAFWMISWILGCVLAGVGVFIGLRLQGQAEQRGEKPGRLFWATMLAGSPFLLAVFDRHRGILSVITEESEFSGANR
jgi:hypothetical protein